MGQVLGIAYRAISSHLIGAAGYHHAAAQTGAVTLIQRFGSALNSNIHFHMLFLDGVYVATGDQLIFRRVPPPTLAALEPLVRVISERVALNLSPGDRFRVNLPPRCPSNCLSDSCSARSPAA